MHTVEILERAIRFAERIGYRIRQEWLNGSGGGACEFAGQKWIFIDLALNSVEQLDCVVQALRADPSVEQFPIPSSLRKLLDVGQMSGG